MCWLSGDQLGLTCIMFSGYIFLSPLPSEFTTIMFRGLPGVSAEKASFVPSGDQYTIVACMGANVS